MKILTALRGTIRHEDIERLEKMGIIVLQYAGPSPDILEVDCKNSRQRLKNIQTIFDESDFRDTWTGIDIATKYEIVNMEDNMGILKELQEDNLEKLAQEAVDCITEEEIQKGLAQVFAEEDRIFKKKVRQSRFKWFCYGACAQAIIYFILRTIFS